MWQSLLAVVSTLAGVLLASLLQQRQQRADRTHAAAENHRLAGLDAVTALATALADHRRAMWIRESTRLRGDDWTAARAASHTTRAAVTSPHVRVRVLLPELAGAAQTAVDATYGIRNAADHDALDQARDRALEAVERFVTDAGASLT